MITTKETLRGEIKKLLKKTPRDEFHSQGEKAARLLCISPVWSRYTTILIFLSMDSEIDTQPLLEKAYREGKRIFAPRVETRDLQPGEQGLMPIQGTTLPLKKLVFYPVKSTDGLWRKGPFGIREPAAAPAGDPGEGLLPGDFPVLVITPGLAFDREGNRLGRGGAYYDRFLTELNEMHRDYYALGFCMDFQIVDRVPTGKHDIKMNGFVAGDKSFFF